MDATIRQNNNQDINQNNLFSIKKPVVLILAVLEKYCSYLNEQVTTLKLTICGF